MKISDKAIAELLDLITVQKKYQPGQKLPNENDLAVELGVSRTTVREVIHNLVAQNVLEVKRGKGTFVSDRSKTREDVGLDNLKLMHLKIRDLYEMRMMLEPQMAYYAAQRATNEELEEICLLAERIEAAGVNMEDSEGNSLFHNAIAKATHNEFGIRLMEIINDALIQAFADSSLKQTLYGDMLSDHRMILNYLKLRDGEGARQAMLLHMKHSISEYDI